jgi:hypothetical protein
MENQERVIVWDGTGLERVGALVRANQALHAEEAHKRIITLPCDAKMYNASALGGYFMRAWGFGVHFTEMRPQRGCLMALHASSDVPYLHWVARLERVDKERGLRGSFSIVTAGDPVIPMVGALSAIGRPVDLTQIGEPDEKGGWFLRGKLMLRTGQDGLCPLAIQAVSDNLRIRWVALSQSRAEE